jgi:hypothetical protein
MAFNDFTHRATVLYDTTDVWSWCDQSFGNGHWGKMISLVGKGATYCFEFEQDKLLFLLRWPNQ